MQTGPRASPRLGRVEHAPVAARDGDLGVDGGGFDHGGVVRQQGRRCALVIEIPECARGPLGWRDHGSVLDIGVVRRNFRALGHGLAPPAVLRLRSRSPRPRKSRRRAASATSRS